jgi:hypothetical protein
MAYDSIICDLCDQHIAPDRDNKRLLCTKWIMLNHHPLSLMEDPFFTLHVTCAYIWVSEIGGLEGGV